jgi:hypothetical protein
MGEKQYYPYYSHYDIESLPTGGWGYDYFTSMVRYIRKQDFQYLGMTGKFHKSWGEFGGFKNPAALKYECQQMLALEQEFVLGISFTLMDEWTKKPIGLSGKLSMGLRPKNHGVPHRTDEEGYTSVSVCLTGHQMALFQT